jgi:glycosyltransferase involved in cell wall biosynthesis
LFNKATVNLVATELMKSFLSTQINPRKLKIVNITPINEREFKDNIIKKKKQLLFIIPRYEASPKGLDFILRLSNNLPKGYTIVIVGSLLGKEKIKEVESKIINIGPVTENKINELYQNSEITLVPSFLTEAFGRVIIESISNGTPVISSPNCGANAYFKNKSFLKIIPINIQLWKNAIEKMIDERYQIPKNEILSIHKQFSIEKCVSDFKILMQSLLNS